MKTALLIEHQRVCEMKPIPLLDSAMIPAPYVPTEFPINLHTPNDIMGKLSSTGETMNRVSVEQSDQEEDPRSDQVLQSLKDQ